MTATHWHNVVREPGDAVEDDPRVHRLLEPLGDLYGEVVRFRNFCYDRRWVRTHWLPVPVLAVGNLTTGGTGKTPMVIFLAQLAARLGYRPGVVLRGYGRQANREADEVLLLRQSLPDAIIAINADRVAAGRQAVDAGATVVIADDAFQHRRLGRDLNICLIDACFPFGGGRMLPAGRLREPMDGLNRADLVVLTRCDQAEQPRLAKIGARIGELVREIPIVESHHRACGCIDALGNFAGPCESVLTDKRVFALAAIARPEAFFSTLTAVGAIVAETRVFRDHHYFSSLELREIREQVDAANVEYIACTAKDLVKIDAKTARAAGLDPKRLLAVQIEMEFSPDDATRLEKKVAEVCRRVPRLDEK